MSPILKPDFWFSNKHCSTFWNVNCKIVAPPIKHYTAKHIRSLSHCHFDCYHLHERLRCNGYLAVLLNTAIAVDTDRGRDVLVQHKK